MSESSPSSGFSAAKMMRKGAPFQGATGEGRTAVSAASSQVPSGASARAFMVEKSKTKDAPAIGSHAVTAAAENRRDGTNLAPLSAWTPTQQYSRKLWLNRG